VPSRTQDVASGLIGADIKVFSFNKTNLAISPTLLPALSEPGRVHFNLNTSYYVKLWSKLTWNFSLYGNWDNRPPPGFVGSDYGTSSGLSWTFGTHRSLLNFEVPSTTVPSSGPIRGGDSH
jgi:hypothetical protein